MLNHLVVPYSVSDVIGQRAMLYDTFVSFILSYA